MTTAHPNPLVHHLTRGAGWLGDRTSDLMARYPRAVGLGLALVLVGITGFVLAGSIVLIILFAFTVSPEAARAFTLLGLGSWLAAIVPLVLLADRRSVHKRPFRRLAKKAQAGDPRAMWGLVDLYLAGGHGITRDPSQANAWLQALVDTGDAEAAFLLHQHHRQGLGCFRSQVNARQWLAVAAGLGHPEASARLREGDPPEVTGR